MIEKITLEGVTSTGEAKYEGKSKEYVQSRFFPIKKPERATNPKRILNERKRHGS